MLISRSRAGSTVTAGRAGCSRRYRWWDLPETSAQLRSSGRAYFLFNGGRRTDTENVCKVRRLNSFRTVSWRSPEKGLKDQRPVRLYVRVLLDKMQICFEHGVALIGIIHQQKRTHVEPDHDPNKPDVEHDRQCHQDEPAYRCYKDCSFGRIGRKIDQDCLSYRSEECEYCVRLPDSDSRYDHQKGGQRDPRPYVGALCIACGFLPKFAGFLELQAFGDRSLETFKRSSRRADLRFKISDIVEHLWQLIFNLPRNLFGSIRMGFGFRDLQIDSSDLTEDFGFADIHISFECRFQKLKQAVLFALAWIAGEKQLSTLQRGPLGAVWVQEELLKFGRLLRVEIAHFDEIANCIFRCLCQVSPRLATGSMLLSQNANSSQYMRRDHCDRLLHSPVFPLQQRFRPQLRSSGKTGMGMKPTPSSARLLASSTVASP